MLKDIKAKREVKAKARKEAEQIFIKLNKDMAMKDGSFPKTSQYMPKAYNKEAKRVEKQVVKTMMAQYKAKKKK